MPRSVWLAAAAGLALGLAVQPAGAHAVLDHASPAVGSSLPASPPTLSIWFSENLEPAFSRVTVTNRMGQRVDLDDARVQAAQPKVLQIGLKPLPPGAYVVHWRVVSVDTHPTQGNFTFVVSGR